MEEKKYVYRLPPCPDYDMAGVESWLTDMALEGLILEADTPFFGFYGFYKAAPQRLRCRMEPAIMVQKGLDMDPGEPLPDAQALYEEMGWDYVTRYGDFHIYRCADPHAPELHTDEEIQAEALNVLKKRHRSSLLANIVMILIYAKIGFLAYPVSCVLALGLAKTFFVYATFLYMLLRPLFSVIRVSRLRKHLLNGEPIHKPVKWNEKALLHRILRHVPDVLGIVMICILLFAKFGHDAEKISLSKFTGDIPFVTIADLNPDGEYEQVNVANTIRNWENWPFTDIWDMHECASIRMEDGTVFSGNLKVNYYTAPTPALANRLAEEIIDLEVKGLRNEGVEPLNTGQENVRGYTYRDKNKIDKVLLLCDNIVVEAVVWVNNPEAGSAKELWIDLMVQKLISE